LRSYSLVSRRQPFKLLNLTHDGFLTADNAIVATAFSNPKWTPKSIYDALVGWLIRQSEGWLVGEIWLKSAGLHHKKCGCLAAYFLRLSSAG